MNYALDTPIRKGVYKPEDPKYTPIPPHSGNTTQDHRVFTWLHHRPQKYAIFPKPPESGRDKK